MFLIPWSSEASLLLYILVLATRPLLGYAAFEEGYPRFPTLAEAESRVRDDQLDLWVDLSSYINTNNPTLLFVAPAVSVYRVFRNLGLRHIFILDHHSRVVGLVTRKDLVHSTLERVWHDRESTPSGVVALVDSPLEHEAEVASELPSMDYAVGLVSEQNRQQRASEARPHSPAVSPRAVSPSSLSTDLRPLPSPVSAPLSHSQVSPGPLSVDKSAGGTANILPSFPDLPIDQEVG